MGFGRMTGRSRRASIGATLVVLGSILSVTPAALAATAQDPSNVVLVFDVSNSILLSDDGTNIEFAAALEDIADRVEANATELAVGNASISFVAFGRQAITYPDGCDQLALNDNPAAVAQLEDCLRDIAAEYAAGENAPVRQRINTQDTDHVAALEAAADLLPDDGTRSAVIFFTDGAHDPNGTARDDENVVEEVAAAFEGRTPLAILPVGLGVRAGEFETELQDLYTAYFRDMEPCEGRASFSWPEVVFTEADAAGTAVAIALQEVTCSFTFAPPPTTPPTAPPTPTAPPQPGVPLNVQLLAGNGSITVQWLAPTQGAEQITGWVARCAPVAGGNVIEVAVDDPAITEAVVDGLTAGVEHRCQAAAVVGDVVGEFAESAETVVVLGIPVAPGQPRAEPLDASARLTVDAPTGGVTPEQYLFECTNATGEKATGSGSTPSVVVTGMRNGDTFTCVAFAENRIGRSAASVASAAFSPCGGIFQCNPLVALGLVGLGALLGLVVIAFVLRRYARRNRVWITAQVDGGENTPLGWGPEIGIRLERDAEGRGWFASFRPADSSDIRARYSGRERFVVTSKIGTRDVHQGDPAPVRDDEGGLHQLILRRYRQKPRERAGTPPPPTPDAAVLGERLEGKDDAPAPYASTDLVGGPPSPAVAERPPAGTDDAGTDDARTEVLSTEDLRTRDSREV